MTERPLAEGTRDIESLVSLAVRSDRTVKTHLETLL